MLNKFEKFRSVRIKIPKGKSWKDFLDYVEDKYGTTHTVAGIELQKAIDYHLAMEGWKDYPEIVEEGVMKEVRSAHSHKISPADKILIQKIYQNNEPGDEVNFKVLCKWMRNDCGLNDTRTHKSHINALVDLGVLISIGDENHPYHLYEVSENDSNSLI